MPRQYNREIVFQEKFSNVEVEVYSTGATYFTDVSKKRRFLQLNKALSLLKNGLLERMAFFFSEDATCNYLYDYFPNASICFDYNSDIMNDLEFILDSKLHNRSKAVYVISCLKLSLPLGKDYLSEFFKKRPDPVEKIKKYKSHDLPYFQNFRFLNSLSPGFYFSHPVDSFDDFLKKSLLCAFVNSKEKITYEDFLKKNKNELFVDHFALETKLASYIYARRIPYIFLKDLTPDECATFILDFVPPTISSAFFEWAKERFDSNVILSEEDNEGEFSYYSEGFVGWQEVFDLMTTEEREKLMNFIKKNENISKIFRFTDSLKPLFAFFFVVGGEKKFTELYCYIKNEQAWEKKQMNRKTLKAYMKTLDDEYINMPLEWSLSILT